MGALEDLQAKVAELQTSVDAEQQQINDLLAQNAAVITGLNEQIAALQAQLATGATAEQLQGVIDGLNAIKTDIEGTV